MGLNPFAVVAPAWMPELPVVSLSSLAELLG